MVGTTSGGRAKVSVCVVVLNAETGAREKERVRVRSRISVEEEKAWVGDESWSLSAGLDEDPPLRSCYSDIQCTSLPASAAHDFNFLPFSLFRIAARLGAVLRNFF